MKRRIIALLCAALLVFTGAYAEIQDAGKAEVSMILGEEYERRVLDADLYYASSDGAELEKVRRTIIAPAGESAVRSLIEAIIMPPGGGLMSVVPGDTRIIGIEECGGFVSVNLAADASAFQEDDDMALLTNSVCATLISHEKIEAVNILINSMQEDICGVPVGVMNKSDDSMAVAIARYEEEYSRMADDVLERKAAVYFPAANGLFVVPEVRDIRISRGDCVRALLEALDNGPENSGLCLNMEASATGTAPMSGGIYVNPDGLRILDIEVTEAYMDEIELRGIEKWQAAAAFTMTMCSFVPGLDGVRLIINGDAITEIAIRGAVKEFGEGIMCRADFDDMVGSTVGFYFPVSEGKLRRVERITSSKRAASPYSAMLQLIAGPSEADGDVMPCMPDGTSAVDLLGVAVTESTAIVNMSMNFYRLCQMLDEEQERYLVYSIVNTLCEMNGIGGVSILIEGENAGTLSNSIFSGNPLMANPGMLEKTVLAD